MEKTIEGRMWEGVRLFWFGMFMGLLFLSLIDSIELIFTEVLLMMGIYFLISLIEIVVEIKEKIKLI